MAGSGTDRAVALARHIALRYVGGWRGGGPGNPGNLGNLVSFMSAIAIGGLALGVALLLTVLSIMNGFDHEMRRNVLGIVPHISLRGETALPQADWLALQANLESKAGIVSASPLIEMRAVIATGAGNRGVMANGIDPEREAENSAIDRFMLAGGLGTLAEKPWGIVLGEALARELEVAVGDPVRLYSPALTVNPLAPLANFRRFEVSGVFRVGSSELDRRLV